MGKLVVSEFVSIDGVMEDPGGAEGFDRGGWAFEFDRGSEGDRFKLEEAMESEALLLGRITYEGFAEAWPGRSDEVGFADKMNSMAKFVVSTTMEQAEWSNSVVIGSDIAEAVAQLKQNLVGNILVAGSCRLVQTLLRLDLVDELRLMVFPVLLGAGKQLFTEGEPKKLRLSEAKAAGETMILTYEPTPESLQ